MNTACRAASVVLSLLCSMSSAEGPVVVHVAPGGDDARRGDSVEQAVRTPRRATARVRELQAEQPAGGASIEVVFHEGTYVLDSPWRFEPADSGRGAGRVTYRAAAGEKVVISGGVVLEPWAVAKTGGRDVWTTRLPMTSGIDARILRSTHELFVGGKRRVLAREPDEGYFTVRDVPDVPAGTPWHQGTRHLRFQEADRSAWADAAGGECVAFTRWVDMYMVVSQPDLESCIARFNNPTTFLLNPGDVYFLQNRSAYLDHPGEWFIDEAGVVTYLPAAGESPTESRAVIPVQPRLIEIAGKPSEHAVVEHVTFEGLTFSHARWWFGDSPGDTWPSAEAMGFRQAAWGVPAAIEVSGARDVVFRSCEFSHVGGYGVEFTSGCSDNVIESCTLSDLGAGGIKIGETSIADKAELRTSRNTVRDSVIDSAGHLHRQAVGVWIGQSDHNTVEHNRITNIGYTGISIGWTWGYGPSAAGGNRVEANEVGYIGRRQWEAEPALGDMAGIYTLGTQEGTVIRGNYFHDVAGRSIAWGIYFDEGSTGVVAEGNVVLRTTHGSFHQHYGKENVVRRNLLCMGRDAQLWRTRREEHTSFTLEDNVIVADNQALLAGDWSSNYIARGNIYWRTDGSQPVFPGGKDLAGWQAEGHEQATVVGDPGVVIDQTGASVTASEAKRKLGFDRLGTVGPRR